MSTLKTGALRGTSGTADSVQLHASNQSVTFPGNVTVTGTLTGGAYGPAFRAYLSADQTISNTTWTRVAFNTEDFDTDSCYNTSTYQFTPNKAGIYQMNFLISMNLSGSSHTTTRCYFYKNGSYYSYNQSPYITDHANQYSCYGADLISLNGSSDYVEVQVWHNNGGDRALDGAATRSCFSAIWLRPN